MTVNIPRWWYYLLSALLLPALLLNLGRVALIDDEGIRALVALEMLWSGNYLVPTLHGELYYNKPPLWNWILASVFGTTGQVNEWTLRLPAVICLLGYAATIYYYLRRHYSHYISFFNALLLLTCGRLLFWDSMLGLIDIAFSWTVFVLFMEVYHRTERQQWGRLFVLTYALTAVAFLFKGLPALVFQALTLGGYLLYRGHGRRLVSGQHLLGLAVLGIILGSYYWWYGQYVELNTVWATLFSESSKRTAVTYGLADSLRQVVTFPGEMFYHFLPWSLMLVYFVRRDIGEWVRQDKFIAFCVLAFVVNIVPYWVSPQVYPRYLLMHAPLIFAAYLYLHQQHRQENSLTFRLVRLVFWLSMGAVVVIFVSLGFNPQTSGVPGVGWWMLGLLSLSALFVFSLVRHPRRILPPFVGMLLLLRIAFNVFVLPTRDEPTDSAHLVRQTASQVGHSLQGQPFFVYDSIWVEPATAFYLERAYGGIIPYRYVLTDSSAYYLIEPSQITNALEVVDSVWLRHAREYYPVARLRRGHDF